MKIITSFIFGFITYLFNFGILGILVLLYAWHYNLSITMLDTIRVWPFIVSNTTLIICDPCIFSITCISIYTTIWYNVIKKLTIVN
jgi:hypothetical protein